MHNKDNNIIGEKIKKYRLKAGLTQEKLAREADISYTTLTKMESGVIKNPSVKVVAKIAKVFKIPLDDLVS